MTRPRAALATAVALRLVAADAGGPVVAALGGWLDVHTTQGGGTTVRARIPHDGDDDAIRIANDSIFGLSGGVSGADRDRVLRVARRIRTGTMSVNGGLWYGADVPFGGYKQSGLGREMGVAGFEEYLEIKSIAQRAS